MATDIGILITLNSIVILLFIVYMWTSLEKQLTELKKKIDSLD